MEAPSCTAFLRLSTPVRPFSKRLLHRTQTAWSLSFRHHPCRSGRFVPVAAGLPPPRPLQTAAALAKDVFRDSLRLVSKKPAETIVLSVSALSVYVAVAQGKLDVLADVAGQVAARPEHVAPEGWVLALLLSSAGRLAATLLLCVWIARRFDRRFEDYQVALAVLSKRQDTLAHFSREFLDSMIQRMRDAETAGQSSTNTSSASSSAWRQGMTELELSTLEGFAEWYCRELEIQEAILGQVLDAHNVIEEDVGQQDSQHPDSLHGRASGNLSRFMKRLGVDMEALLDLPKGRVMGRYAQESKPQGPHESIRGRRANRMGGIKPRKDPLSKERTELERLLRLPRQIDASHHPAFIEHLNESRQRLEASAAAPPPEWVPEVSGDEDEERNEDA